MRKLSHVKLGLFLLFCIAAGAVAVIWVGATHVFERSRTYAAFFADPVTGLQSGAPVRHLGIQIGRVDSVELAPGDRVVQVLVKLKPDFRIDPAMALSLAKPGITGSPFLALEETPPEERNEPVHPSTRHPVLPTRPGGGGIGAIEKKIASLDLEGLVKRWEGVASKVEASIGDGKLDAMVGDLQASARSIRAATQSIARQVDAIPPGTASGLAARLSRAADLSADAMQDVDENVGASAELLRQDLAQLRQAVVEAQSLARSLRNQPGRILEQGDGSDPFRR